MDTVPQRLPSWKRVFEQLTEDPAFTYGSTLTYDFLEKEFFAERYSPKFQFELMRLRDALKAEGYILTAKGMLKQGFRVFTREEMSRYVAHWEKRKVKHTFKSHIALTAVDTQGMSDADKRHLDFWTLKTGMLAASALRLLRQRKLPATPEMDIKSIRQIQ